MCIWLLLFTLLVVVLTYLCLAFVLRFGLGLLDVVDLLIVFSLDFMCCFCCLFALLVIVVFVCVLVCLCVLVRVYFVYDNCLDVTIINWLIVWDLLFI